MPEDEWQALAGADGLDSGLGSSRVFGLYLCSTKEEAGAGLPEQGWGGPGLSLGWRPGAVGP